MPADVVAESRTPPPAVANRLRDARSVVVLTGAGVSAESGLGTFRGPGGLWADFRPEDLATPEAFARQPDVVWRWYSTRWLGMAAVQPNPAHHALVRWEAMFPSFLLVTQNIDGLHRRAGSRRMVELHGFLGGARCVDCGAPESMEAALARPGAPPACACGGLLRPDVVWFGELLPEGPILQAAEAVAACDLCLVVGTSGLVWPAAGLAETARRGGACVIEINTETTKGSGLADWHLRAPAGEALPALTDLVGGWRKDSHST